MPDVTEYADGHWAAYCLMADLDDGDLEDQDYDGDSLPPVPPPPDDAPQYGISRARRGGRRAS